MKNQIFTNHFFSLKTKYKFLLTESLPHKITTVSKRMAQVAGIRFATPESKNLNEYSSNLIRRIGKNYQSQQKKSNFICVSSSASAYNLTHNEISANIEKHQKLSEARWNDNLIEYICNH